MAQGQLIFISGGVRSGKSSFGELYATHLAESKNRELFYLATSISFDNEMTQRINRHQETRNQSSSNWQTIEAPYNISNAINNEHKNNVILLDCLTVWLNNEFYQKNITEQTVINGEEWQEVKGQIINEIKSIRECVDTLIIVSNDISYDEINPTVYVNLYSRMLGELHQTIVSEATQAFAIESTIPILMKQS